MISKSALKIFGFDVVWKDRSLAGTKLLVICPTISKDGNLLMEKMLFSIGFHLKDDNVLIIRSELKNYRKNEFLLSFIGDLNFKNSFSCVHPDEILNNLNLKRDAWTQLCELKAAIEKFENQN